MVDAVGFGPGGPVESRRIVHEARAAGNTQPARRRSTAAAGPATPPSPSSPARGRPPRESRARRCTTRSHGGTARGAARCSLRRAIERWRSWRRRCWRPGPAPASPPSPAHRRSAARSLRRCARSRGAGGEKCAFDFRGGAGREPGKAAKPVPSTVRAGAASARLALDRRRTAVCARAAGGASSGDSSNRPLVGTGEGSENRGKAATETGRGR